VIWDALARPEKKLAALLTAVSRIALLAAIGGFVLWIIVGSGGWAAYLAGTRAQLEHQQQGHAAFFLGELSRTGWIAYFPVALLMKLPPLTLLLAIASLVTLRRGGAWDAAVPVAVVPLALMLALLLFARIDIGVRYALPLWPLIIVCAARAATLPWTSGRPGKIILGLALVYHVTAAVRIAPHDLAFFSDLAGGPSRGAGYLSDSNLDWGQDISTLARWLTTVERPRRLYLAYFGTADPRAYGVRYRPAPNSCPHPAPWMPEPEPDSGRELLAVSVMNLQGVYFNDRDAYGWLASRQPVAVLGYSIAVYDITEDAAAHTALDRMYERYGGAPSR